MVKEYNVNDFSTEVLQSELPVLVKFSSPTCYPCKMMVPVMKEAAEKFAGKLKVGEVDVSKNMPLAEQYKIMAVPALILFDKGDIVKQFVGYLDLEELELTFGPFLA